MKVALLGYGTVGVGVYEMLIERTDLTVAYVLDRVFHPELSEKSVTDIAVILGDPEVDTVIEVIGGLHPAYEFVTRAIRAGKNVVTANKLLLCHHYVELTKLAVDCGVSLRYTAAVGGGIPWLVNLQRVMRLCKVQSVSGIMNGTSNFILDAMQENDEEFDKALKEAQRLGYAERDPSADIDGQDSLCKLILSADIAFSADVRPSEASVCGIRHIQHTDVQACRELGRVCRLMAYACLEHESVALYVEPTFVKQSSLTASVHSNLNLITFEAEDVGAESFYGYGAGRYPTAYTVVQDCLDLENGVKALYNTKADPVRVNNADVYHRYYVRTDYDKPDDCLCGGRRLGDGYLTRPVSVKAMHDFLGRVEASGAVCFAAGVEE